MDDVQEITLNFKQFLMRMGDADSSHYGIGLKQASKNASMKRARGEFAVNHLTHEQVEKIYITNITKLIEMEVHFLKNHHTRPKNPYELLWFLHQLVYLISRMSAMPHKVQPPDRFLQEEQMEDVIDRFLESKRQFRFERNLNEVESTKTL